MSEVGKRGHSPFRRVPCRRVSPQEERNGRFFLAKWSLAASLLGTIGLVALASVGMKHALVDAAAPAAAPSSGKTPAPPPLEIDEEAPLLLDAPIRKQAAPGKPAKPPADNSACYVCHANYQDESLVKSHLVEGTGCVQCHGESFAHRNDENNTTPPDIMFPRERIDRACTVDCHETHDAPPKKILELFQQRCSKDTDWESIVCTDCHGVHRLKVRTVRWDKKTGQLISVAPKP
jgi:hypothetical protein